MFDGRVRSVRFAFSGIHTVLRTQKNAWIHAVATAAVLIAGLSVGLGRLEWCLLVAAMMAVWTAEALNTSIELLADVTSPGFHPLVGRAKDVAAGAVLLSAVGSVAIGIFVFEPHWSLAPPAGDRASLERRPWPSRGRDDRFPCLRNRDDAAARALRQRSPGKRSTAIVQAATKPSTAVPKRPLLRARTAHR